MALLHIDLLPISVVGVARDGIIVATNEEMHRLLKYTHPELLGTSVDLLLPAAVRSKHEQYRQTFADNARARRMAEDRCLKALCKDGTELAVRIALLPVGDVAYAFVFDLTDLTNKALALRQANADLEQFAYAASHDLQEPLRGISGFVKLIAERYRDQLDEQGRYYCDRVMAATTRLSGLINDLLLYARAGRDQPNQTVPLADVLREAVQQLAAAIGESDARIEIAPIPSVVTGYYPSLVQVFQNLISNSIKFTPRGSKPRVEITASEEAGKVVIALQDNGIGIPPEHRAMVFEVFRRLHARDEYPGSGMGLALVKRIVERHGGTIEVGDAASGTLMLVRLPLGK